MKFCRDCRHFTAGQAGVILGSIWSIPPLCGHPDLIKIEPVNGYKVFSEPAKERESSQRGCGPDALLWEARDAPSGGSVTSVTIVDTPKPGSDYHNP